MSKNDPHILGKESIGKLLLQYSQHIHRARCRRHGYRRTGGEFPSDESGGCLLYTCFCRRFHARIYPARAERYERGYGNPVAHVNALYHQFFLFRNIVFYLPR